MRYKISNTDGAVNAKILNTLSISMIEQISQTSIKYLLLFRAPTIRQIEQGMMKTNKQIAKIWLLNFALGFVTLIHV